MFVHLPDATDMSLVLIASECFRAIDADQRCRSAPPQNMRITLFLLESSITIFTDEGDHFDC